MKLYSFEHAPNPRRVRIFAAEKGISLAIEEVDLRAQQQLEPSYQALNPAATVPTLVLDDGTAIGDSMAICRYLEERYPAQPLFGSTAVERAQVEYWSRRADFEGMGAVAEGYRNHVPFFKDRALPGPRPIPQVPELAERGLARSNDFLDMLDQHLATTPYVVGDRFTMADISMLVSVDMASWMKLIPDPTRPALLRWHQLLQQRPSVAA